MMKVYEQALQSSHGSATCGNVLFIYCGEPEK